MHHKKEKAIELLMGIDIGSTNIKCVLCNRSGEILYKTARRTSAALSYGHLIDLEKLWELTVSACREAVYHAEQEYEVLLCGIAVAGVGCVPVLLDMENVPVLADVPDNERMAVYRGFAETADPDEYSLITGYTLEPHTTAFYLAGLDAGIKNKIASVLSVSEYICFKLTGIKARDYSNALSMAVWDYRSNYWWKEFLNAFHINPEILGCPVDSGKPVGPLTEASAEKIGLPMTTMVYTGGHDYLCSALACNIGTGGNILNVTGTVEIIASFYGSSKRPFPKNIRSTKDHHVVPGQVSLSLEAMGAAQVEWLYKNFLLGTGLPSGPNKDMQACFMAMHQLPPVYSQTRELFIPQLYGRMIPKINGNLTGAYLGLSTSTDAISLLRATIEGLCFQARQMVEAHRNIPGNKTGKLKFVGGGSRNALWCQMKADILHTPVHVPRIGESTALGAALLAGVGCGMYKDYNEAGTTAEALGEDIFSPNEEISGIYQNVYENVYLPALEALEELDNRMSAIV